MTHRTPETQAAIAAETEAFVLAWQQGRHDDTITIMNRIRKLKGSMSRHIDRRDDDQKDYDEEREGIYR